jgi:hypothetical protein
MTHHFDEFQQHLLDGFSLIEAAYASIPVVSWQAVVLGDPLYRPFLRLDGSGEKLTEDRAYRALRVARLLNADDDAKYLAEIERVGREKKNPIFLESLGLIYLMRKQEAKANSYFSQAKLFRDAGRREMAVTGLRAAETLYSAIPEVEAVRSLIAIMDPPPPPPVQPGK